MRLPDRLGFRGKTLWDWLQLLIVPAILIGVTFAWSATQTRSDNRREDRRIAADRAAAEEARQDATLQGYLDQMSGLMLDRETADLQARTMRSGRSRARSPSPRFAAWTESGKAEVVQFLVRGRPPARPGARRLLGAAPSICTDADLEGADLGERRPLGRRTVDEGGDERLRRTPTSRAPTSARANSRARRPRGRRPHGRRPHGRRPHGRRPRQRRPRGRHPHGTPTSAGADLMGANLSSNGANPRGHQPQGRTEP